ncbi:hypothetical protein T09_12342 [Trichinella sp. T9]|nr:hypothetical protein T09_12342 [Trichinella sp. T9]
MGWGLPQQSNNVPIANNPSKETGEQQQDGAVKNKGLWDLI